MKDIKEVLQKYKEKVIKEYKKPETDDEKEYYLLSYWEDPGEFELRDGNEDEGEALNVGGNLGVGKITLTPKVEEFHLLGQHDQFKHAPGGSDGEGGINVAKVAAAVGAVVVGAGLVYYARQKAPGSLAWSASAKRSDKLEATLAKGGSELDDAIAQKVALIKSGKHTDRDVRDLAVLQGKFLHQDDASSFIRQLSKEKYTTEEKDALWEYAGMYELPGGSIRKGPVLRFHDPLRAKTPLSDAQQETMRLVDQAIRKNGLPRPVTLYRGARISTKDPTMLKLKVGETLYDDTPMFTGLTEARATPHFQDTLGAERSVLFEIRAPKGHPAIHSPYGESIKGRKIPIPVFLAPGYKKLPKRLRPKKIPYARVPLIEHLNKEEIVLPSSTGLRILKITEREDGVMHVLAEAVE